MDASRLFLDGADREAVGAAVAEQRAHVRRVEAQATTAVRRVRNRRPIVAEAADEAADPAELLRYPEAGKKIVPPAVS